MKRCPDCPDQGWYASSNPHTGEPEQVQCEFCECEPDSVFNTIRGLQKELDELKASIPKIKADAVDRFLHEFRYGFEGELTFDRIEDFADQLKE